MAFRVDSWLEPSDYDTGDTIDYVVRLSPTEQEDTELKVTVQLIAPGFSRSFFNFPKIDILYEGEETEVRAKLIVGEYRNTTFTEAIQLDGMLRYTRVGRIDEDGSLRNDPLILDGYMLE